MTTLIQDEKVQLSAQHLLSLPSCIPRICPEFGYLILSFPVLICRSYPCVLCFAFYFLLWLTFPPPLIALNCFICPCLYLPCLVFVPSPRLSLFSHPNPNPHLPPISRQPPLVLWGHCLPLTLCWSALPIVTFSFFLFHLFLPICIMDFFLLNFQHFWNVFSFEILFAAVRIDVLISPTLTNTHARQICHLVRRLNPSFHALAGQLRSLSPAWRQKIEGLLQRKVWLTGERKRIKEE